MVVVVCAVVAVPSGGTITSINVPLFLIRVRAMQHTCMHASSSLLPTMPREVHTRRMLVAALSANNGHIKTRARCLSKLLIRIPLNFHPSLPQAIEMLGRYILALLVLATSSQSLAAPYPQDEGGQQSAPAPVAAPSNAPDPTASTPDYPSNPASFGEPVSQPSQSAAPAAAGLTGEVVSDIPLSCVAGCSLSQTLYE